MRKWVGAILIGIGNLIVLAMIGAWTADELFGEKSCFAIRNWGAIHLNSAGYSNCIFGYSMQMFLLLCLPTAVGVVIARIGRKLFRGARPI